MWVTEMQMMGLKKRVSFEEEEIPHDDLPDAWYERKEISLIEFQYFKTE